MSLLLTWTRIELRRWRPVLALLVAVASPPLVHRPWTVMPVVLPTALPGRRAARPGTTSLTRRER